MSQMPWVLRLMICLLCLASPNQSHASSALCEAASLRAAQTYNIPPNVMRALMLTETGRRRDGELQPWPWTVNMEGEGRWFDTRAEALDYIARRRAEGARSFDVGCFQINHRWHGQHFASIPAMFDPDANADYAARYLQSHFETYGSWPRAAGRYHSGTEEFAQRYRARFENILARMGDAPPVIAARTTVASAYFGGMFTPYNPEGIHPQTVQSTGSAFALRTGPAQPLLPIGTQQPLLGQ